MAKTILIILAVAVAAPGYAAFSGDIIYVLRGGPNKDTYTLYRWEGSTEQASDIGSFVIEGRGRPVFAWDNLRERIFVFAGDQLTVGNINADNRLTFSPIGVWDFDDITGVNLGRKRSRIIYDPLVNKLYLIIESYKPNPAGCLCMVSYFYRLDFDLNASEWYPEYRGEVRSPIISCNRDELVFLRSPFDFHENPLVFRVIKERRWTRERRAVLEFRWKKLEYGFKVLNDTVWVFKANQEKTGRDVFIFETNGRVYEDEDIVKREPDFTLPEEARVLRVIDKEEDGYAFLTVNFDDWVGRTTYPVPRVSGLVVRYHEPGDRIGELLFRLETPEGDFKNDFYFIDWLP